MWTSSDRRGDASQSRPRRMGGLLSLMSRPDDDDDDDDDAWRADAAARARNEPAGGALRWCARLSAFDPSPREFEWLRTECVAEPAERDRVLAFVRPADRRRALLARLLVRRCASAVLGADATIERTAGGKPFVAAHDGRHPNFNVNARLRADVARRGAFEMAVRLLGCVRCGGATRTRRGRPNAPTVH